MSAHEPDSKPLPDNKNPERCECGSYLTYVVDDTDILVMDENTIVADIDTRQLRVTECLVCGMITITGSDT